jgi:hypothetical protein
MRGGILLLGLLVFSSFALFECASGSVDVIDFQDLEVDGWALDSITEGDYGDFVILWEDLGVSPSDYMRGEVDPHKIYLLIYSQVESSSTVYVEIHLFDSEQSARNEFYLQKQWAPQAPMFKRFLYGRRMFQEGNVLLFFFSNQNAEDVLIPYNRHGQTYITLVDSFIVGFFERFSPYLYPVPETPVSNFTGRCVWGIRPGDVFSWERSRESFTGSLSTGMSHSKESGNFSLEIVEFTEDESWVLVRQLHESFNVINYYGGSNTLDSPFYSYAWIAAADGSSGEIVSGVDQLMIYPLYYDGKTLRDFLEEEIGHLPEKNFVEGEYSLKAHGRTSSYSGFTPLKTEWRDITVHSGTGIITYYEFYYNDNEYSITTTSSLSLLDTNIDMNSREPYLPSLVIAAQLSSTSITQGETLGISVHVEDEEMSSVEGASAIAVIGEYVVQLADEGGGDYQGQFETSDLQEGQYEVVVGVESNGYESAQEAMSFIVEKKATGIPGFPIISVVLGILIGVVFLFRRATVLESVRPRRVSLKSWNS